MTIPYLPSVCRIRRTRSSWTLTVLSRIHKEFYAQLTTGNASITVMDVMRTLRRKVLKGYRIVLSGVLPRDVNTNTNMGEGQTQIRHDEVRWIEEMGGKVYRSLDKFGHRKSRDVTPRDRYRRRREVLVVGNKSGSGSSGIGSGNGGVRMKTEKEKEAARRKVRIVGIDWLRLLWWKMEAEDWGVAVNGEEERKEEEEYSESENEEEEEKKGEKEKEEIISKLKRKREDDGENERDEEADESSVDEDMMAGFYDDNDEDRDGEESL